MMCGLPWRLYLGAFEEFVVAVMGNSMDNVADVELQGVRKSFRDVVAVDDVSVRVERGEFFSLLGPSGCGKTTTLRMIAGFEHPTAGEILIQGRSMGDTPAFARNVNTVFQHYALFPHMTVAE